MSGASSVATFGAQAAAAQEIPGESTPLSTASAAWPALETARGGEYSVRVAVRCRPLLPKETSERCRECVGISYEDSSVLIGKVRFAFDHVFGTEATQERVHEDTARPLLECLGQGQHATLLAYGQTSSGKTYTLGSCNSANVPEDQQGVIPRFVNALFRDIVYPRSAEAEVTLRVTFVELHNEDINDLLEPNFVDKSRSISIRDDPQQGVVVGGVKQIDVKRPSELLRCLEKGAVFRTTASTNMNEQSSRSHAIFTVSVEQQMRSSGETLLSKVRFADLAGSERAKKTGTVGERFREGVNINQGLLALGNVISALGDPKLNRSYVPYRDSKLTRLLQDSLGGNSRTVMIACVSPADVHFSETLNTLKYANRAKNIKNKVTVNFTIKESDVAKLQEQLQEMQMELARTKQLQLGMGGDSEGLSVQDLLAMQRSQNENSRLREELKATQQSLREATEEALQFQAKYEYCTAKGTSAREGDEEEGAATLLRYMTEVKDLKEQNKMLKEQLRKALTCQNPDLELEEAEPGSEPPAGADAVDGGLANLDILPGDEMDDTGFNFTLLKDSFADNEEALAHVAEDQLEEEQFQAARSEMRSAVLELDDVIKQKEALMEQLTKQSKVFRSMQARYELRLRELREAVGSATEDKEKMVKEMQQLVNTKQCSPQEEGEAAKRKAHLQGRLHEVNRQLVDLQRRQGEAQRLLRLKEQQETQIRRMHEEIDRLKGQKLVVVSRMKCEEQQHRLWRRRCDVRLRELLRKGAALERTNRRQNMLLGKKTKEAEQSARRVQELKREQQQILEASRRRSLVQRETVRTRRLREVNERLQSELEERERKVQQLETVLARRARLQEEPSPDAAGELNEVEDNIEMLDAQIDFATECIAQSQTDILRLTSAGRTPGEEEEEEGERGRPDEILEDGKEAAGTHSSQFVAKLNDLEDAKATCLACFQALDEAQGEAARLKAKAAELEADLAQRAAQVEELQAWQRLAEARWAEQSNELQRQHLNKEAYLLLQVDRDLAEAHGLSAEPQEDPLEMQSGSTESLTRLLRCRSEQIEVLEQHAERLQLTVADAEKAREQAELALLVAQGDAERVRRAAAGRAWVEDDGPAVTKEASRPEDEHDEALGEPLKQPVPQLTVNTASTAELRSVLSCRTGVQQLEGVAQRTGEMLKVMWDDLGIDEVKQQERLGALAEAAAQLYSDELRTYESWCLQLQREHDGIRQMAVANNFELPPELHPGGVAVAAPLHQRHAVLEKAASGHLERSVARLREDLIALYNLPADAAAAAQPKALTRERLAAAAASAVRVMQGREGAGEAAVLQPRDLDVLGLGLAEAEAEWLVRPSLEAFAYLEQRQNQVSWLLADSAGQLQRLDLELLRHHEALGVSEEERSSFLARRGRGLPALAASQQELLQLQHSARISIAQGRVRLVEKWMELGTPQPAQDRVLQTLKESSVRGPLEELRTLNAETQRMEEKLRHRQTILDQRKSLQCLEEQIQEFEREASNSARLRGNSVKLLQEEQQRKGFRKRKLKHLEDLLSQVGLWETTHGERFLHQGMPLQDVLRQDLDDLRELGGLTLAADLGSARKSSGVGRGSCDGAQSPTAGFTAAAAPQFPSAAVPPLPSARRATTSMASATERRALPRRAGTGPVGGRSPGTDSSVGCSGE